MKSEQPTDLKPISSSGLEGVVPREGMILVMEADPEGGERVWGKRSKNSIDKTLFGARLSIIFLS